MKPIKKSVLRRYVLFQIPDLLLVVLILLVLKRFIEIPDVVFWVFVACWVAKDILFYPLLGRFYDPNFQKNRFFSPVGKVGIIKEALVPKGKVQVKGELWQAEILDRTHSADVGETVRVRGVNGLTLLVESEKPK
jgi:membrane protein implicated in regulation of membrane protease activity